MDFSEGRVVDGTLREESISASVLFLTELQGVKNQSAGSHRTLRVFAAVNESEIRFVAVYAETNELSTGIRVLGNITGKR